MTLKRVSGSCGHWNSCSQKSLSPSDEPAFTLEHGRIELSASLGAPPLDPTIPFRDVVFR